MRIRILGIILVLALLLAACESEEEDTTVERFHGIYRVYDQSVVGEKNDSVRLTVTDNQGYSLVHWPNIPGGEIEICNSRGELVAFGSSEFRFVPSIVDSAGCDHTNIPRGIFSADFRDYRNIMFDRIVADSVFSLQLTQELVD